MMDALEQPYKKMCQKASPQSLISSDGLTEKGEKVFSVAKDLTTNGYDLQLYPEDGAAGRAIINPMNENDAKELAAIIIQLYQDYPLFFKDVDADDHDLDMDRGFKTYDEMVRNSNAG